jgi:hypothetical protein
MSNNGEDEDEVISNTGIFDPDSAPCPAEPPRRTNLPRPSPKVSPFEERFAELERIRYEGEQRDIAQKLEADQAQANMQAVLDTNSRDLGRLFDSLSQLSQKVIDNNAAANQKMVEIEQANARVQLDTNEKLSRMMAAIESLTAASLSANSAASSGDKRVEEENEEEDPDAAAPAGKSRTRRTSVNN